MSRAQSFHCDCIFRLNGVMLIRNSFKNRLIKKGSLWLRVAVDASNENQFYIVGNGGMGTTISAPLEQYLPEIKQCVLDMLINGELEKNKKTTLLLDRNILVYFLNSSEGIHGSSVTDKSNAKNAKH